MNGVNNPTKLGVIGAGGVGSATAYAAMVRGSADEIVLYDIDGKRAHAEALDIAHGAMFAHEATVTGGDDIELLRDCDMVIITAGARQKPGQPRLELAGANVAILEKLLPNILSVAPNAIIMLVTNPCDVLTVVAQKITGLPANRVLSSGTVLDSSRLRWLIANKAGVSIKSVHANVVGEWEQDGKPVFTEEVRAELATEAMRAAYKVIEGKGSTNYAIGISGARIAEAFLGGQNAVLPVSTTIAGELYGFKDVALSLPTIVNREGIQRVLEVPMNEAELAQLKASAEAIRASAASLGF